MAKPEKPGLDIVFGMGKPGPKEEHDDDGARDLLVSSLHDVGIKGDEASNLVDALHEYIKSCVAEHEEPEEGEEHEEEDKDEY